MRSTVPSGPAATARLPAVRFSPDGVRVSPSCSSAPDRRSQVWIGAVVAHGTQVSVDGLTPITPTGVVDDRRRLERPAQAVRDRPRQIGTQDRRLRGAGGRLAVDAARHAGLPPAPDSITVAEQVRAPGVGRRDGVGAERQGRGRARATADTRGRPRLPRVARCTAAGRPQCAATSARCAPGAVELRRMIGGHASSLIDLVLPRRCVGCGLPRRWRCARPDGAAAGAVVPTAGPLTGLRCASPPRPYEDGLRIGAARLQGTRAAAICRPLARPAGRRRRRRWRRWPPCRPRCPSPPPSVPSVRPRRDAARGGDHRAPARRARRGCARAAVARRRCGWRAVRRLGRAQRRRARGQPGRRDARATGPARRARRAVLVDDIVDHRRDAAPRRPRALDAAGWRVVGAAVDRGHADAVRGHGGLSRSSRAPAAAAADLA